MPEQSREAVLPVPIHPEREKSPLGWLGRLNQSERHTWLASFGGLALDAMDSQAYALAIPSLLIALHLSTAQAGTFATAALVGQKAFASFADGSASFAAAGATPGGGSG